MAFKRSLVPAEFATGDVLTSQLVAIGFCFSAASSPTEPNIEDTLIAASIEGVTNEDYRVLSLLVDWFSIHFQRVNADRLTKLVKLIKNKRIKAFWAAMATQKKQDTRFKKLQNIYTKPKIDLMGEGTSFQMERHGEDPRFAGTVLRVPGKLLRHRPQDILSPENLAKRHRGYYFRVMIGPSYRADMWALLEHHPTFSAAEVARQTYGSFPTAWETRRDLMICATNL